MKCKYNPFNHFKVHNLVRYFLFGFLFVFNLPAYSQLNLDFDDGNINAVFWEGDIQNFIIRNGQLQLNAPEAGQSTIFTKYKTPQDSIQFDLYFNMQFAPSNDNSGKIYLFTDNTDESIANGYYLKLGENGSQDAIHLFKLIDGTPQLMGSGQLAAIAASPAQARVRIKLYRDGFIVMDADYSGGQVFETDLEVYDPDLTLQDSLYFGILCSYTATRTDKFFYDDIHINTIIKDTIPPIVVDAQPLSDTRLKLLFSKAPSSSSVVVVDNYRVNNGVGVPSSVNYSADKPQECVLNFSEGAIKSGISYTLTVENLVDKIGNTQNHSIDFFYVESPNVGDIVINEVLTDPFSGGEDFIELYNKSTKYLKLDSLIIANDERSESRVIRTDFVLLPGKYVAISKNIDFLKNQYQTPDTAAFIEATIPAMNVATANISVRVIKAGKSITLDSFDYYQGLHFSQIKSTKGFSLERINFSGETNDPNNWHSASSVYNNGTPGYKNSNAQPEFPEADDDFIELDRKVFSPDGDGYHDFVQMKYTLPKSGYLATIRIFDVEGLPIMDLANNELLGTETTVKWDGTDAEGRIVKTGMYIVYSKLFHPDGDTKYSRKVVVAAQKF